MSKRKRDLTTDEKKLWRRVAETVRSRKPLPEAIDEEPSSTAPKAPTRSTIAEPKPVRATAPKTPARLEDRGSEKRVRRGRVEIRASLDLHGHTQASARAALVRFLTAARARDERAVIVITGVGRGGVGVLKRSVPEWLAERDLRALTSGYAQAHRTHGGAGAYYVFLKRRED